MEETRRSRPTGQRTARHIVHCLSRSGLGGAQQVVYTLLQAVRRESPEIRFTVILPPGGIYCDRFNALGISTELVHLDRLSLPVFLRYRSLIDRLQPDVIHSHGKGAGLYARCTDRAGTRPLRIHSYHGFHPPAHPIGGALYRSLERYLLRRTDRILAVSESEANEVRTLLPAAAGNITVIPNVVDRGEVQEAGRHPLQPDLEAFLTKRTSTCIFCMIGRNDPVKNVPLAFDALRTLLRSGAHASIVIVGADPADADFESLRAEFPDALIGVPPLDNAAALLTRCGALLSTSRKEGSPLTVLEAFVLGVPVVGTDVPGLRDVVHHGTDGLLCAQTPAAIAEAMVAFVADASLRDRLRAGAQSTGMRQDVRAWADRYLTLYETAGE